nr:dipeptidase [Gemmatimonadaceae bacterium]
MTTSPFAAPRGARRSSFVPARRCTSVASAIALLTLTGCAQAQRGGVAAPGAMPAAPATAAAPAVAIPDTMPGVSERAMRLWRSAITIDTHNDMPTKMADDRYDADVRHPAGFGKTEGHTDLPRLVESGITAVFMSSFVDAPYAAMTPDSSFGRAVRLSRLTHDFVRRHPDRLVFVTTAEGIRRAKADGKVAILIGVEGGHAIQNSLDNLRRLHDMGVRYMTLTWNNGNPWAGAAVGVGDTRTGGLTDFGRSVIREMNRLGILVDISHVSDSTFWDAVRTSTKPVIASHSSARAINTHPRNMNDDMLRAVATNGGVVNINFFSRFIDPRYSRDVSAIDSAMRATNRTLRDQGIPAAQVAERARFVRDSMTKALRETPLGVLLDHFQHVARVAGVDHVGIGSDFDGVTALPVDMQDVTMLPRLVQG